MDLHYRGESRAYSLRSLPGTVLRATVAVALVLVELAASAKPGSLGKTTLSANPTPLNPYIPPLQETTKT